MELEKLERAKELNAEIINVERALVFSEKRFSIDIGGPYNSGGEAITELKKRLKKYWVNGLNARLEVLKTEFKEL